MLITETVDIPVHLDHTHTSLRLERKQFFVVSPNTATLPFVEQKNLPRCAGRGGYGEKGGAFVPEVGITQALSPEGKASLTDGKSERVPSSVFFFPHHKPRSRAIN
ncbi:hypothetical protein CEXT_256611 [Caerostris extrusa]|uniref:Uncharacterized protein n=1 Tax=Caerostris extrusa TaxID=172846 RepID=A0AAV4RBF6_CAEEX|nr:hypothetical protein CEXT_256611 [Caerostris extrusa]